MGGLTWNEIYEFFGYAIAATVIAGAVCPLVGTLLLVRRTGFYGIALPQFAATGVAFGFVAFPWSQKIIGPGIDTADLSAGEHIGLNYHLFWASIFTFGALGVLLLGKNKSTEAARIAAGFAIASAATIVFAHSSAVGDIYVHDLLRGEILAIGLHEFDTLAVVLAAVALTILLTNRDLILVSYDRESARVLGKPVVAWESLLQILTGATVATGVMTVGPVLLFGTLVIPPLAARSFARSMSSFFLLSSMFGLLASLGGLWTSFHYDLPLGPAVVLCAGVFLIPSWLVNWRSATLGA